ncbi:PD-(D/E)XK nuclease superfamily protein [Ralstonia phage DU_RP_II]|nr:PD-(D/E)XK nuclease superfamily protein [Ralstonia phage DU_RP_II]
MENELLVEQRFHLHELHSDLFGTSDAIVWQPHLERLSVIDLKYGAGVPVEVEDNPQLQYYALGALLANKQWKPREVEVVIVQPRCPHPDGPVRTQVLQVVDLLDFAADLVEAVKRTEEASAAYLCADSGPLEAQWQRMYLEPGDHCRFCPAAAICPAQKNKAQQLAKQAFAPGLPYDAKQLAETLEWLPVLEAWIKNTREFAYAEAEKGHDIPRHKLVEKRATRKWRELSAVDITRLEIAVGGEVYDEPSLKSPAAIEKLLPKDQRKILDDLCIKESSGHTLVHESDRREAIKVDARSAFSEVK